MNSTQRMASARLSLALALAVSPALAADIVRTPVSDARPVLLAALQSSDGTAHGILTGEAADAITGHFSATSAIFIDVSTEKRYQQAGCSRLKVLLWQEGVRLPGAQVPRKQTIEFGINYCLDGLPPKSLI
ncbi:hypothetical protein [Burkholderia vietnamiensis]|uniref:hypothetical protein n=1 Tax=Burkholderia vietnamiensis TaxID=60552 RepID=UPI001D148A7D|nr:hypothetical protein [Burkholderia vietnamiensis]UEC01784.1 hypothetical protein LK462_07085 [Burkholderia vietnamiensis]